MTRHSFIQMSKLPNIKGRISYITSPARQENLYATYQTTDNTFWSNLAKDFLQGLIRQQDMPPKPTLDIDMAEFRTMRNLMIRVQDKAREIRSLQDNVLPKLKQQLAEARGVFKSKERKALTEQIARCL